MKQTGALSQQEAGGKPAVYLEATGQIKGQCKRGKLSVHEEGS